MINRIKIFNKRELWKYSIFGVNPDPIFNSEGLGLDTSYKIYQLKQKDSNKKSFKSFLINFFSAKDINLPHFLPTKISTFDKYGKSNNPIEIYDYKNYFHLICEKIFNLDSNLLILQGASGSGKTTLAFGIVYAIQNLKTKLNNYIPIYLNISYGMSKTIEEILSFSSEGKFTFENASIHQLLIYSQPLIIFLDTYVINNNFENTLSTDKLIKIIKTLKDLISNTPHKLIICHRGTMEIYQSQIKNEFYESIQKDVVTWEINKQNLMDSEFYISKVGGNKTKTILKNIPFESENILEYPLFADFIILMSITYYEEINVEIKSIAHFYLLFTRSRLNYEYNRLKTIQNRDNIDTWVLLENNYLTNSLIKINSIELFLQNISLSNQITNIKDILNTYLSDFENKFLPEQSKKLESLEKVFINVLSEANQNDLKNILSKYLNDIEKIFLNKEGKGNNSYKYLDNYLYYLKSIENKALSIQNVSNSITLSTFITKNINNIEFFHSSLKEFYIAFSFFYDLNNTCIEMSRKDYYKNILNRYYTKTNIMVFFIGLAELVFSKDNYEIFKFLFDMDLDEYYYFGLGVSYQDQNKYDEAIEFYKKAIKKGYQFENIYYNLGNMYMKQEDFDLAIENFKKAIQINPHDEFVYNNLGNTYYRINELDEAIKSFKIAVQINPNDAVAYNNLGNSYYAFGELNKSIESFKEAIRINPYYASAYNNLGVVYRAEKNYDKSLECFNNAINFNPYYAEAYYYLALICCHFKNKEDSIKNLQIAIEIDINYVQKAKSKIFKEFFHDDPKYIEIISFEY